MGERTRGTRCGGSRPESIYRPRSPRASPLWQCVTRHGAELREAGRYRRAVEERVLHRFVRCGDPKHGFARIRCDACGHDALLAFSCKTRYFCPSCHQKRVLIYGEWLEHNVLEPVPHRQYVFTLPKLLRGFFAVQRARLGHLCRIVAKLLGDAYAAAWARLIAKVYEADPLECPRCRHPMRVIALIEDRDVIQRILEHLGKWIEEVPETQGSPPFVAKDWPRNAEMPLSYHPVPDIA